MKKIALVCLVSVFLASPLAAKDDDSLVRFDGGIGVIPVSNVTVNADGSIAVSKNIVRGVNPPGQIWRIERLKADIETDGRIKVEGRGLLLAGGNSIGLSNGLSVFATLICDAALPFTQYSTTLTGVKLAPDGDFEIDDVLTPTPPAICASPVLLIRSTGGTWFAAGILKLK